MLSAAAEHAHTGAKDSLASATQAALAVARQLWVSTSPTDKDATKHACYTASRRGIEAMLTLAQSHTVFAVEATAFDADAYLLNVANGTIDLRTGTLRPHCPSDLISKLAGVEYDPGAQAPGWADFLTEVFGGDAELIGFVQQAVGLSLIGAVVEHVLFLMHGNGANGKSTFLDVVHGILGDYAKAADPEVLLTHRDTPHPQAIASLAGFRFVSTSEIKGGRKIDEGVMKRLTGGDKRTARFMRSNEFSYTPADTFWCAVNDTPSVADCSAGFWRRMKRIPFAVEFTPDRQVRGLAQQLLEAEGPGILRWAVEGCLAFLAAGSKLPEAKAVELATAEYREQEDYIARWMLDCCEENGQAVTCSEDLYHAYEKWAAHNREQVVSRTQFGKDLSKHRLHQVRNYGPKRLMAWRGVSLLDEHRAWDFAKRHPRAPEAQGEGVASEESANIVRLVQAELPGHHELVGVAPAPSCLCGTKTADGLTVIDCLEHCPI